MHSMQPLTNHGDYQDANIIQMQQEQHIRNHQEQIDGQRVMTGVGPINPSRQLDNQHQHEQQPVSLIELQQQQTPRDANVLHIIQQPVEQPQLHSLQPSLNSTSMDSTSSDQMGLTSGNANEHHQQYAHQTHHSHQQSQSLASEGLVPGRAGRNNLLRQRHQVDGLEHGGPTAQWLQEHYEVADGESIPRSLVYNHYLARCRQTHQVPVNAASFGKLIRSVFIGLRTRRLGTRGHSKYHYFGVRSRRNIQADLLESNHESGAGCSQDLANNENSSHHITENGSESNSTVDDYGRLSTPSSCKRVKRSQTSSTPNEFIVQIGEQTHNQVSFHHQQQQNDNQHQMIGSSPPETIYYNFNNITELNHRSSTNEAHNTSGKAVAPNVLELPPETAIKYEITDLRRHLGSNSATLVDEHWPQREPFLLERQLIEVIGSNESDEQLQVFEARYKSHYKQMLKLLSELKFADVERLLHEFWNPASQNQWSRQIRVIVNGADQTDRQQGEQQQMVFHSFYQLTSQPLVIKWINEIDFKLYGALETFLLPDILNPIPRSLVQQIRQFAKNFGPWVELAVKDYDIQFSNEKSKSARAFGSVLRRYTSLNHLSTASRAIWEKRSALTQMSMDLSRLDLRDIEHQVSLMSRSNIENVITHAVHTSDLLSASANISDVSIQQSVRKVTEVADEQMADTIANNACSQARESKNQHHNHSHQLCAIQPGQLIQNFMHLLENPYPADTWPDWCRNLVESRVCGMSVEEAKNFVLKWNFYISLIMKELTLRSAPSFGSFQLIRLLFDEYIFYLVVSRVAQAQHKTSAQLLSL